MSVGIEKESFMVTDYLEALSYHEYALSKPPPGRCAGCGGRSPRGAPVSFQTSGVQDTSIFLAAFLRILPSLIPCPTYTVPEFKRNLLHFKNYRWVYFKHPRHC
jgi:hypothetical protein